MGLCFTLTSLSLVRCSNALMESLLCISDAHWTALLLLSGTREVWLSLTELCDSFVTHALRSQSTAVKCTLQHLVVQFNSNNITSDYDWTQICHVVRSLDCHNLRKISLLRFVCWPTAFASAFSDFVAQGLMINVIY